MSHVPSVSRRFAAMCGHGRTTAALLLFTLLLATPVLAQKQGGTLRITHRDSPASMSIHEEGTISVNAPMMSVFNNLVMFDQHVRQNSLDSIVPELAKSWRWSDDGKTLTFALREGVTWHDGKPFTAADVKCTWDLLAGTAKENFKLNFRKGWYANVESVTVTGPHEAVFNLKKPQPGLLALLASGFTPVYPCHVSPREMRQAPIGTGPFKFVEYKANQNIKLVRNPNYWKPGLPYLDILSKVKERFERPTFAYHVSGEYAMLKAAAQQGWLDEKACLMETMLAFKRAGADGVITYAARDLARWLKN